ncbi:FYVE, RhoGEF and PH domain-containing protein 4 [Etheostoma spectabile]|uniref:FYVE, RhoGEF and PH domain-containing protein 4 n=1 Tax=Etheostoma spectabile TaxID=54343 RepID=UPI0013AF3026|nr:FYVE, RhoGEF and PH domain-containing protein 4-like [Etheostoma spectabile]
MFDLKRSNSLTLNSRETEFSRVAVRRKVSAAVDCLASHTVPPKSTDLQTRLWAGQAQPPSPSTGKLLPQQVSGTEQDQSPNISCGVSVSCVSPVQNCLGSPSPIRGGGNSFLNVVSEVRISPARQSPGSPHFTSSPLLGFPSPDIRGTQRRSPLREGGQSPTNLTPRNRSPLARLLRTPSPVQGRMGSYSPTNNSKSWIGLHRIPSTKMEGQDKRVRKSLSVPDLIVLLKESRIPTEKVERTPLKPLQSANCSGPAITIKSPVYHRLNHSTSEVHLLSNGKEQSPGQLKGIVQGRDCTVVNETGEKDKIEEGKIPVVYGSKSSCQWNEATIEDGRIHKESKDEQKDVVMMERGVGESKDEENIEQKLFNIANELLQTERAYVARLHLLDQVFCSRLTEEAGRGSFPPDMIRNIFSNISSIYSFHNQFLLPDLESCISNWCDSPGLGTVLLQHAPFLRMYADYVINFDQAMELVRTWTERSSVFRNIIQDIQSQEVCGSLTLQHHMLEPVQRIPRYEMLLTDYLKKLPKNNPDYDLAYKSLQTISMAAIHSNRAIHKAESLKRLVEIYEMVGEEEVVNPTNEFLREGRLLKLAARNTSAMERHLFLFNNFLMCCTPKFSLVGQRFTVRCRIGVDGMQVQQTTNEDHPYTFQVSGKERTLELQASSKQDRDQWIKVIQEAIDMFQKNNETFKLASRELNIQEPAEELGRRAPRWIRDNEVTVCMKCQDSFNALTRRRHHCRACGCVVCGKCLDHKVALEYDGNKLNKVCKACYSTLTGQRVEENKRRILELEESPMSSDCVMSGFLLYGDNPKTWQQVWTVISHTEPPALHLYTAPQDVKPLSSIPLLGCSVVDSLQELNGQLCFCLSQSLDVKQGWLKVLKVAVIGRQCTPNGYDFTTSSSTCGISGTVQDGSVCTGEECIINGNEVIHS